MKWLRFEVTAEDIAEGERYDVHNCPLAIALRRKTGKRYIEVNHYWTIAGIAEVIAFKPSARCRRFIRDFDAGLPVKPGRYEMMYVA